MKKLLLVLIFASIGFLAKAQRLPIDTVNNAVIYSEVVFVDNIPKDELYTRAREWFARTFRSAQNVLQMDDKSAGKIIGKGNDRGSVYLAPLVASSFLERYTISITVKDGKYKYAIFDFTVQNDPYQGMQYPERVINEIATNAKWKNDAGEYRKVVKGYIETTIRINETLSSSLKVAMANQSKGLKIKDDF